MIKRVLVIASHPDDEILGCGGTLKKLINDGFEVITVITAKGRKEEEHCMQEFMTLANKHLGIKEVIFLQYPNLKLETYPLHDIVKEFETIIEEKQPDIIFTHHYGDLNRDHQVTFQAVLTATRPMPLKKAIELICFETVSSSEWNGFLSENTFKPNYFVDITDTIDSKIEALQIYDIEMRPFPHPRSYKGIKSLSHVRGMTIGVKYAEAFEIIRRIWK
jgi:LmbE family N-acetylglucosaminyl deacetylase